MISAPHYIAVEATRRKLIDYREMAGPYRWIERTLEREGYSGLRRSGEFATQKGMVDRTSSLWRPVVDRAIRARALGAAVWDLAFPEWSAHVRADMRKEEQHGLFSRAGYRLADQGGAYLFPFLTSEFPTANTSNSGS